MLKSNKNKESKVYSTSAVIANHNVTVRSTVTDLEDNISSVKKELNSVKEDNINMRESLNNIKDDVKNIGITTKCELKLTQRKQSFFHNNVVKHISYFIILEIIDIILEIIDIFLN